MKRSPSSSPTPDGPTTPPKIKKSSPNTPSKSSHSQSKWDADKTMALAQMIVDAGIGSLKPAEVAAAIGITTKQYNDATTRGRNNLRLKLVKAAAEMAPTGSPTKN